ncbi:unnamed protein product [Clavelina lepadiformis]|uniref:molybdopterin adenylyltransferase n=1 Tax=Clavelina lepadiformis TaxID=159417 RepID=A0ABP0GP47_CLALP
MSDLGLYAKTARLDAGVLGTALAVTLGEKKRKTAVVGLLIVSEISARGLSNDIVGQKLQGVVSQMSRFEVIVKEMKIVSDQVDEIKKTLVEWTNGFGLDLILTVGGAEFSSRDVTPEATRAVIEREVPAFSTAMIMAGLKFDPSTLLFRGISGIRKNVLIINLPGYLQKATDFLQVILPSLPAAIRSLKNEATLSQGSKNISRNVATQPSLTSQVPVTGHHAQPLSAFPTDVGLPHLFGSNADHSVAAPVHGAFTPSHDSGITSAHSLPPHHSSDQPVHTSQAIHSTSALSQPAGHHAPPTINTPVGHHADATSDIRHFSSSHGATNPGFEVSPIQRLSSGDRSSPSATQRGIERDHHATRGGGGAITEDELFGPEPVAVAESVSIVGNRPLSRSSIASSVVEWNTQSFNRVARRPRMSPYKALSIDKAFGTIFAFSDPLPVVTKFFKDAIDYVTAENVCALCAVPPQPTAILDGYAVIANDTPGDLDVVRSQSGTSPQLLTIGKVMRVATGGIMPPGANAVVPVEETILLSETNQGSTEVAVRCLQPSTPGQHIRPKGSDVNVDDVAVKAGTKLGHVEIGLLASVGVTTVRVHRLPTVALISFGKKLTEADTIDLRPGDIRDTNRVCLLLALHKQGYPTEDMGIVRKPESLRDTIIQAYQKADVVLTTGGTAMGENDHVKPLLREIGATIHVGRIVLKPGAPSAFATLDTPRGRKYFFALSGVPVPAYVGYYSLVLPCLRKLSGSKDPLPHIIKVRASSDIYLDTVPEYQRVSLRHERDDPIPWADVTGGQIISRLKSMVGADALLLLPAKSDERSVVKRNELLNAMLID